MKSTGESDPRGGARRYHAPRRTAAARATRRRIVAAAEDLFLRDGYARTSMVGVARRAGVAERTVYLAFATKAALLDEVIVTRIRDDDSSRPLGVRMREMLTEAPEDLLRLFGEACADLMARAARVMALGEGAAPSDPLLAAHRDRGHAAMRDEFRAVASALARHDALADGVSVEVAAATIYALVNDSVYLRLVDGCGWSPDRYGAWLSETLRRALLAPRSADA